MSYIITNGTYYIYLKENGKHRKTENREEALQFNTVEEAVEYIHYAPSKTEGFYVCDFGDIKRIIYKNSYQKRKHYSKTQRKMVYEKGNGRCQLCGREILLSQMTLDHIKPLAKGGEESIENLQCSCKQCNMFKGSILPEDFQKRINTIFLFQMQRKNANKISWKFTEWLLQRYL